MHQDMQERQEYARQIRHVRSKFRRINSLDLIPEDPTQEITEDVSAPSTNERSNQHQHPAEDDQLFQKLSPFHGLSDHLNRLFMFWPNLLMSLTLTLMGYILYIPLSIAAPSFWLSALLWIFWKFVRLPINIVKWVFGKETFTVNAASNHKRTVLISCGSTIQTLHLARNFYSSGARVVVFEFEGLFGLARFSTAVDKFYVVPRPSSNNFESYVTAISHIVNKEKPSVYIPVCATSPAYYDALAKPHLELLGCASFIPGLQDTLILDDCLQFYQKCASQNIPLPQHNVVSSSNELHNMYESGFISNFRNILMAVGMQGLLERYKYILPNRQQDLKLNIDITDNQPWMVVRDPPGYHYVTCTTVKDSRVVANVTCKVDHSTKNLIPVRRNDSRERFGNRANDETQIELWLRTFFAKVRFQRSINGHISFRFVKCQGSGQYLPLGVRLCVSLPYICYSRSHAQMLCRTVKCVHRQPLGLSKNPNESMLSTLNNNWHWSSIERRSSQEPLDKREALFAYWDPLPYLMMANKHLIMKIMLSKNMEFLLDTKCTE